MFSLEPHSTPVISFGLDDSSVKSVTKPRITIREINVFSGSIEGGTCTTGIIDRSLSLKSSNTLMLDKTPTGEPCDYGKAGKSKSQYNVTYFYTIDSGEKVRNGTEVLFASPKPKL